MARLVAVPVVALAVVLGVWVTGGVLTNDATLAMILTGAWFGLAGALALLVAWRRRALAVPVVGTYVVVAGIVGGYLLYTSRVDQVVDEDVVVAEQMQPGTSLPAASPTASPAGPVRLAAGEFRSGEHTTRGTATLVRQPDGRRVLTLTGFSTSAGPDLRVYLVPGRGPDPTGHVDLGALKGNKGDQQYAVPASAPTGAVVIWCRAFSVDFGTATLGR